MMIGDSSCGLLDCGTM